LTRGKARGDGVGIGIARQEEELEDEKACGPHRGCTAEERQDVFAEQELDLKEEKGAEKDGRGEGKVAKGTRWPGMRDGIEQRARTA